MKKPQARQQIYTQGDAGKTDHALRDLYEGMKELEKLVTPAGVVLPFGGATAPTGWLLCDGSAVSRIQYPVLFEAIGVNYGAGDGSTTFNVPNVAGRFVLGKTAAGTGSVLGETGGALDHTHGAHVVTQPNDHPTDSISGTVGSSVVTSGSHSGTAVAQHSPSNPPYIVFNAIIKV